ncbi:MAG: hypothetical protein GY950_08115 [bacterium]|nr:hypothetical protein [bacterium]
MTWLTFIVQYDFLPRSVMPRFIVNMHTDIKENLQWRTGVVLEDRDFQSTAVVKADHEEKRIYLYVAGGQKRDYFAVLSATLRRINQSFEKLKTDQDTMETLLKKANDTVMLQPNIMGFGFNLNALIQKVMRKR